MDFRLLTRDYFVSRYLDKQHYLEGGNPHGKTVVFIHGNTSTSAYWKPLAELFDPDRFHLLIPDLNGFGQSRIRPVDARTGVKDWAADIIRLLDAHQVQKATFVCSSLGGIVGWWLLAHHPSRIEQLIQIAPGSPFGFGGTQGAEGKPNFPDFAASGAGMSSRALVERIKKGDRTQNEPKLTSPSWVLQNHVFRNKVQLHEEHPLLDGMMQLDTSEGGFPGTVESSENWPGYAPGERGIVNAISPKHLTGLRDDVVASGRSGVPVHWLRGSEDSIVSDRSDSDPAVQGMLGLIPEWPGEEIAPPQPMLTQTRIMLEAYANNGGSYKEIVLDGLGHCPYVEDPAATRRVIFDI